MAKFDEFFYIVDNKIHDSNKLILACNDFDFNHKYDGKMFCPECKKAQLIFANGLKLKYLRTNKNSNHKEDCYYNGLEESSNYMKKLDSNNIKHRQRIKQDINRTMNSLFEESKSLINDVEDNDDSNISKSSINKKNNNVKKIKHLKKRKLTIDVLDEIDKDEEINYPIIYYNKAVHLKVSPRKKGGYYLRCYDISKKLICSITINEMPYKYLMKDNKIDEEKIYKIAVYTKFKKNGNYFNSELWISHSDLICIRE